MNVLFNFLQRNQEYNRNLQTLYYRDMLAAYPNANSHLMAYSIFHHIYNTQTRPNLDSWHMFAKWYLSHNESDNNLNFEITDFNDLLRAFNAQGSTPFANLFHKIQSHKHFGPKVSALLVKTIYKIQSQKLGPNSFQWKDFPKELHAKDRFYLPVDAVITYIFKDCLKLNDGSFSAINDLLINEYPNNSNFLVWDDLWFWGYITQIGGGKNRKTGLNLAKYYGDIHSSPSTQTIQVIKDLSHEFIEIIS